MNHCAELGRKVVDLYLMHWVAPHGMGPGSSSGSLDDMGDDSAAEACLLVGNGEAIL